ncbi:coiled-coil domain-containing protein [Clostridium taeniosporum]|uniref:Lipoprotein n=1 Tax=Clostridium taeniosporum TaxID=394958 RepID=A0A1D7XIG6_9CLOT|nr:hypothetical protein [Clostridium taeniosporum]AOR23131.1 hypothetical protein BGI42_05065 [Clostridium taeniosporum]
MRKKNLMIAIGLILILGFSLLGCNLQDDYVLTVKQSEDETPSSEKVDEIFDSEDIQELKDKLRDTPSEIADKMDEFDEDKERLMKEFADKADELTDKLNQADLKGKSEDLKDKFDEIMDKLDEIRDDVDETKDKIEDKKDEDIVDKTEITDLKDQFELQVENLQNALDRLGKK